MARHQHHKGNAGSQTLSPSQRYASFQKVQRHRASAAARFAESLPFELDDFQTEANDALEAGSNVLVAAPTGAGAKPSWRILPFISLRNATSKPSIPHRSRR